MNIDETVKQNLEYLFPGVIIETYGTNIHPKCMHIRTDNWHISPDELFAIQNRMGLHIDAIYTEGGGSITLVIDKESTKKVISK